MSEKEQEIFINNKQVQENFFNTIIYVILPALIVFAFIYGTIITRENSVDYILFITTVTIIYSLMTYLYNIFSVTFDLPSLYYFKQKLLLDDNTTIASSIFIQNENDKSSSVNINETINTDDSITINGEVSGEDKIANFYNKQLNNIKGTKDLEKLTSIRNPQCLGTLLKDKEICAAKISGKEGRSDVRQFCEEKGTFFWWIISLWMVLLIAVMGISKFYGIMLSGVLKFTTLSSIFLFVVYKYFNYTKQCVYYDEEESDLNVTIFDKEDIDMLYSISVVSIILYFIGRFIYSDMPNQNFWFLIVMSLIFASTYMFDRYAFVDSVNADRKSLGYYINTFQLNRENGDTMKYNIDINDENKNQKCMISGIWDKRNMKPRFIGNMPDCNENVLGMYIGIKST